MKTTEHNMKTTFTATGLFALPCGLPRVKRRGASLCTLVVLATLTTIASLLGALVFSGVARAAIAHDFLPTPSEAISKGVPAGAKAAGGEEALAGPVGGETYYSMTVAPGETSGEAGHLWITGPGRVDEFNASSGEWESQLEHIGGEYGGNLEYGVAVGRSTGEREVYVTAGKAVAVFGSTGKLQATWTGADTPGGSFNGHAPGLAVDSSTSGFDEREGDVYVGTSYVGTSGGVVDVFEPEAGGKEKYVTQLTGTCPVEGTVVGATGCEGSEIVPFNKGGEAREVRVAVNPASGDVLVAYGSMVDIFRPTVLEQYEFVRQITGVPGHSFAPHPINGITAGGGEGDGDFYVSEGQDFGAGVAVYEFSSEGAYLGSLTETPAGPFRDTSSVAVDPASGEVYVGDTRGDASGGEVDVFGPDLVIPDVLTSAPSEVTPYSAILNGTVNPLKEGKASCQFVWGTSEALGHTVECEPKEVAEGDLPVKVRSEELEGLLRPDTRYFDRLEATNRNGTNTGAGSEAECEGKKAPVACFTTSGPGIESESASGVASTSATLDAEINPNNAPTSYHFEYGSTVKYGSIVPGATIGSGTGAVAVGQHVQGLSAGAVYHYRVVVESEIEPGKITDFDGSDQTFTTQVAAAFGLPDGREWEMVSPPNKEGALIEALGDTGVGDVTQAATGGDAISYLTNTPTEATPAGYAGRVQVLSTRGPRGWVTRDLEIPHTAPAGQSVGYGEEYRFFSEDLSQAVVQPFGSFVPLSDEASESTSYLASDFLNGNVNEPCLPAGMHCYRPLATGCPAGGACSGSVAEHADVPPGTVFGVPDEGHIDNPTVYQYNSCPPDPHCGPVFEGASPDGAHVVVSSEIPLTSDGPTPGQFGLYEWEAGKLSLISVLPAGEGAAAVTGLVGFGSVDVRHAVSDDGSRVFWEGGASHLYLHVVNRSDSVRLDVPQPGATRKVSEGDAVFQDASPDGSRVWFTDTGLTRDSSGGTDLYECEIADDAEGDPECELSDLTPQNAAQEQADVLGSVAGASEEGCDIGSDGECNVYFVANAALAPGAIHGTCGSGGTSEGECNLYVRHDNETRLVAVLPGEDRVDWASAGGLNELLARVSPNGRWLAFISDRGLTGYDTRDAVDGKPDQELYLYDAQDGKLVCASCDPSGARPRDGEDSGGTEYLVNRSNAATGQLAATVPAWDNYTLDQTIYEPRFMSDSGRVFFDTPDGLVPKDVNGTWDVYEYEPQGVGSCAAGAESGSVAFKPAHAFEVEGVGGEEPAGCVAIISSGGSAQESAFMDASASGGDVFFLTTAKLAPQDYDDAYDIYDAHECTDASPCPPAQPTAPPECTTADACRAALPPQPAIFGAPSSATFNGAGNITPTLSGGQGPSSKRKAAKCKRGRRLSRGRCVRAGSKKRKAKAKHSNRGAK